MEVNEKVTRVPGVLWLLSVVTGGFGLGYVRNTVIVLNDAAATVANLQSSEMLFRLAVTSLLVSQVFWLFFLIRLYGIFRPTSKPLAMVLLLSMLISSILTAINTGNHFAAMLLLSQAEFLKGFSADQITSAAYAFLRFANGPGQGLIELFWPVFYATFGLLIVRSRIVPTVFGYLLMLMAAGFVVNLLNKYLFPWFYSVQFTQLAMLLAAIGAIPTILCFLIKGVPRSAISED